MVSETLNGSRYHWVDLKISGDFLSGYTKILELLNSYFVSVFSEEEGGDLLKSGFSFPGTPEEELGTDTISQITCSACPSRGWVQAWGWGGRRLLAGTACLQPHSPQRAWHQAVLGRAAKNLSVQPFWEFLSCYRRLENRNQTPDLSNIKATKNSKEGVQGNYQLSCFCLFRFVVPLRKCNNCRKSFQCYLLNLKQ